MRMAAIATADDVTHPRLAPSNEPLYTASEVVAPVKPSTRMLAAGAKAGNVSVETAWKIYLAMTQDCQSMAYQAVSADQLPLPRKPRDAGLP